MGPSFARFRWALRRLVQGREPLKWAYTPGYAHKENKDNQDRA